MEAEIWWNTEKARNDNTRTFKVYYCDCYVMSNILSEPKREKNIRSMNKKIWTKKNGRLKEKIEWKRRENNMT